MDKLFTDQSIIVDVRPEWLGNRPMTDGVAFLRRSRDEDEFVTALPRCSIGKRSGLHRWSRSSWYAILFTAARLYFSKQHKLPCHKRVPSRLSVDKIELLNAATSPACWQNHITVYTLHSQPYKTNSFKFTRQRCMIIKSSYDGRCIDRLNHRKFWLIFFCLIIAR